MSPQKKKNRRTPRKRLQGTKKNFSASQKKYLWVGEVSTMENKDINTDYHIVVRVEDQKWEIIETTFEIIFLFEIRIHYFLYREFQVTTIKNHPYLKCQSAPPTKKSLFEKSPFYIHILKNGSTPPFPRHHPGRKG